jgi:hypothetical protein
VPADGKALLQWFSSAHTLYWDFHNPFSLPITFDDFEMIANAALEEKHPLHGLVKDVQGLKEPLELLRLTGAQVAKHAVGMMIDTRGAYLDEVIQIKTRYLQELRTKNQESGKAISIGIMGAGPGGWTRALVAGIKGAQVQVIENRTEYTRDRVIKVNQLEQLLLLGVTERLIKKGQLDPDADIIRVPIYALEQTLEEIATELFGTKEVKVEGKVIDGLPGGPQGKGAYLYKLPDQTAALGHADLIVDATGAKAQVASSLLVGKTILSEPQMMFSVLLKKGAVSDVTKPANFQEVAHFSTPNEEYLFIQLSSQGQAELKAAQLQVLDMQEEIKRLKNEGKAISEQRVKLQDAEAHLEELMTNALGELGISVDDIILDRFGKKSLSAFSASIEERKSPCHIVGNSLVMQSGDALATPDPKAALGATHALLGATLFSKALDDLLQKVPLNQIHRTFSLGAMNQARALETESFGARGSIASATLAFHLRELVARKVLTSEESRLLESLDAKARHGIAFTAQELAFLVELEPRLEGSSEPSFEAVANVIADLTAGE